MELIQKIIVSWGLLFLILVAFVVFLNIVAVLWQLICKAFEKAVEYMMVAIVGGTAFIIGLAWDLLRLLYETIAPPVIALAACWETSILEFLKLWQLYWQYGREEFRSFRSFSRYMRGEGDDREPQEKTSEKKEERKAPPEQPADKFKDALQLLGFSEADALTKATLKQRHRELISRVHPDKGCPTPILAQQINDAVNIIKQRRNWK
ncbi:MAG: hypothetical protein JAZ17_03550 [Candidatus Thiodiazotropha endolucinida]|nr:hypothetical protein [Candidatus Thiodiazotropha taylori]MCG8092696.1 hypothetical protein [Candidatus Thiodiazotropha endolucinida]MCG8046021.1 hypothetical protein [Candidatus Thiodiazotropha taylori]MCG8053126.1 hypothetical protein [Candidatus Thiodiazotropha taylori]MCG8072793.1 hypothetical protein [Candidatus Thiodiazotropha taylori]